MRQKSQGTPAWLRDTFGGCRKAGQQEGGNGAYGQLPAPPSPTPLLSHPPIPTTPGGLYSEGLTCRDTKRPPSFGGERLRGAPKQVHPLWQSHQARPLIKDRKPFHSLSSASPGCG